MSQIVLVPSQNYSQLFEQAYAIFCQHRINPWRDSTFYQCLKNSYSLLCIDPSQSKTQVLGYVIVSNVLGEVEIEDISVHPQHRQRGIATIMMRAVVNAAVKLNADYIFLEVNANNAAAIKLYRKLGFKQISIRKGYYQIPDQPAQDALLMQKLCEQF